MMRLHVILGVLFLALCAMRLTAAEFTPAVGATDLDLPQCTAFEGAKALGNAPAGTLEVLLGLAPPPAEFDGWSTGLLQSKTLSFRVAFTKPLAIGTLISAYSSGQVPGSPTPKKGATVSYLKPAAAYPGDVTKDDQWVMLPPSQVKTLPPGVQTRALRFQEIQGEWGYGAGGDRFRANLRPMLIFKERYFNALDIGHFKVTGKQDGPKTWLGTWNEAQLFAGIAVLDPMRNCEVDYLKPTVTVHYLLAEAKDWKRAPAFPGNNMPAVYRFDPPASTRVLRLQNGNYPALFPLVNLGDKPDAPSLSVPSPPFNVKFNMPLDGFTALTIFDKQSGKRVRRLIAEVERGKGVASEPWDLKDDSGKTVPPGEYLIKGIARPPFKLTYQLTPYNAGQPPWWAPSPGKGGGGWMADHTPPQSAVAIGDQIFLSSPCNESGDGVIAVDRDGNKLWGENWVNGFDIAQRLAADDRYVYVINPVMIQRIDTKNQNAAHKIYDIAPSRELPACKWSPSQGGLAARNGKLYFSSCAPPNSWLQPSFLSEEMDPDRSSPRVWLAKGNGTRPGFLDDKIYGQEKYDELMRFYAAFLTEITPAKTRTWASTGIPNSAQAYFGDAPEEGPMAGNLIAAFRKPVTVGTVMIPDGRTQVYALKPGAPLPCEDPNSAGNDPEAKFNEVEGGGLNEDDWVALTRVGTAKGTAIFLAPPGGLKTEALRFKTNRLGFALVTARRFDDLAPQAERAFSEGAATTSGGWSLARPANNSVNKFNPPAMVMAWKQPVTLRGVSLVQPRGGVMTVDTYIGPAGADPLAALKDDKQWKQIGIIKPEIFQTYFPQNPSIRNVDFGDLLQTRALRIKALSSPCNNSPEVGGPWPANTDVLAGVVAFHYLGDDPPGLPPDYSQRISVFRVPEEAKGKAEIITNVPVKRPGNLAFDKDGKLYGVSAGRIVQLPLNAEGIPTGETKVIVPADQLDEPASLAIDAEGLLYISDMGPQVVKVFDQQGKLVRTIGKPGGHKPGPWDPYCMDRPTGIAIDSAGKLWVAHNSYQPKRISRWSRDGKYETSFLGPTAYGGGGYMDENNRNVVNYNGMKFVIDWTKMDWKLDSILYRPGEGMSVHASMPDYTFYYKNHRYLVGFEGLDTPAVIAEEHNNTAVPLVIAGNLGKWNEVSIRPELAQAFGSLDRREYGFIWVDKNSDGIPQVEEVQTSNKLKLNYCAIGEDLSLNGGGYRLRPKEFLPNGTPVYDIAAAESLPLMSDRAWATADGRTFTMVDQYNRLLGADGKSILWDYWDEFAVFAGWYASGYGYDRPAGVLNAEQYIFGHLKNVPAKVGTEDYWVTNSDQGDWFLFTDDGFLVGCIFGGPTGYGLRRLTMPEWTPGKVDVSDVRMLQECYQGQVLHTKEGVYAIAGKNHMSVVRVDGLEQLERYTGTVTVSAADIEKTRQWELQKATLDQVKQEPKVTKVPYVNQPLTVDGSFDDWPSDLFFTVHEYHQIGFHIDKWITVSEAAMAYDDNNLYIAARALDDSPMQNAAGNLQTLFKTGDALDLTLGLDPKADPKRTAPVPGDVRLLISRVKNQPVAMLYRYKSPGATPEQRVHFSSPVSEIWLDEVRQLTDAKISITQVEEGGGIGWHVEAAIPWKSLGVAAPVINSHLTGDVGVLQSDQNGVQTVNRLYWSGKSQRVVTDLPSEARIVPSLWGDLYFTEPATGMVFGPDDKDPLLP